MVAAGAISRDNLTVNFNVWRLIMTTGDKLSKLRKENGYTQEQLAELLGVSRQAISKWESDSAFPETDKLIKLSDMYGCTVDYLLKDGERAGDEATSAITADMTAVKADAAPVVAISNEDAMDFLAVRRQLTPYVAGGVFLCILSPALLILLSGFAEAGKFHVSEGLAVGLGMTVLLLMVAVAVYMFIAYGMKTKRYEFMDVTMIQVSEEIRTMAGTMKEEFAPQFGRAIASGTVLCILSVVPLFISGAAEAPDYVICGCVSLLLLIVACGVFILVRNGMIQGSFDSLLQEGDYTEEEKRIRKKSDAYLGAYWLIVTAIYLGWSFLTERWDFTWIVWPVAGVLFAAIAGIIRARVRNEQ